MTGNDAVLALMVVTALGFDFTNGFHDTGFGMGVSPAYLEAATTVAAAARESGGSICW
ncbi:hypothetical protein ACFYST_19850 [Kitasatospora sp. NPDC004614]|uniref:hypothetical protein n=1 Tax=unclassified Kitasatospora TaxID=2633591 RepID=UPI0036B96116